MSDKKKLKMLELAISLYPCPPFRGRIIPMTVENCVGLITIVYSDKSDIYQHVSEWRNRISNIIGFYTNISMKTFL